MTDKQRPKAFWCRDELPASVVEFLMNQRQGLLDDFMRGYSTLEEAAKAQCGNTLDRSNLGIPVSETERYITTDNTPTINAWKSLNFRYERHDERANVRNFMDFRDMGRWPTMRKILMKYDKICPIANYSVLAPHSVIERHTGPENRDGRYIRIHIPLIIPEGNVFFEAAAETISWRDIWAFHNQFAHSAHNYSNEWRLVCLIDLDREAIGMEKGTPYDPAYETENLPPFVWNGVLDHA
jgi:hypothetical protein